MPVDAGEIKARARALGFADVGIARPVVGDAGGRLRDWVAQGHHGEMSWMADRVDWRADPAALWPAARSVIMLADSYVPGAVAPGAPDRAAISTYAQGKDYHDVVKSRLKDLGRWLIAQAGGDIKVFVDTAPVMEKPLAQQAGLGWQGRHTNLVSRRLGSWFFLGAVFTTLELDTDPVEANHCGTCRACLDICPTAAFPAPYQLDARRCISYLTIELKGPIPRAMRPLIGNRVLGCDDCLAVCPWNKFAREALPAYAPRGGAPALADLAALDDAGFRAAFRGTPVRRLGRARFLRNVLVAMGNSGLPGLAPAALRAAGDPDPLVRGHAVWTLSRLLPPAEFASLRRPDPDPGVEEEWRLGLTRSPPPTVATPIAPGA